MYLNFYNLAKEPFNITPDPELLYLSPSHKEALAAVVYGVKQRKGFIAIIGEVGVGKTTVLRSFLDMMRKQRLKAVYLFNANLSFRALLRTIYQSLGHSADTDDIYEMVDRLHQILIEEYKAGNNVVLVIDEAQNMPVETLENLRMLSNLESATDKLIQVVFSGQPEFEDKLDQAPLRQLKQRIVITARILPLTRQDSLAYIEHRLDKTAKKERELFSGGALKQIVGRAHGIPRVINILCDNCLITSFGRQQKKVSAKVAREIIADLDRKKPDRIDWKVALPAGLVLAAGALLAAPHSWRVSPDTAPLPAAQPAPEAAPAAAPQQVPEAAPAPARQQKSETAVANGGKAATAADRVKLEQVSRPVQAEPAVMRTAAIGSGEKGAAHKVVRRGDTLARLIVETYGFVDRPLLERVKRRNPNITNENVIVEGDKIYFPTGQ